MKKISIVWLVLVQWVLAFQWLHSGIGKFTTPGFMNNIGKTLQAFSTGNPRGWYSSFLQNTAIPNAQAFGNLIRSGEVLVGVALVLGGILFLARKNMPAPVIFILVVANFAGALMNLNFFFAAGWMSPSTWGVNVVMGLLHLVIAIAYISERKQLAE